MSPVPPKSAALNHPVMVCLGRCAAWICSRQPEFVFAHLQSCAPAQLSPVLLPPSLHPETEEEISAVCMQCVFPAAVFPEVQCPASLSLLRGKNPLPAVSHFLNSQPSMSAQPAPLPLPMVQCTEEESRLHVEELAAFMLKWSVLRCRGKRIGLPECLPVHNVLQCPYHLFVLLGSHCLLKQAPQQGRKPPFVM